MSLDDASRYLERQRQTASNVVTASGTHRRALREGEWACVDAKCAYINADRVSICERCGKSKPRSKNRVGREIGKDAAEKSKGLFAAEDWACTKCGNVNWARRTACNICNAPKLGDLEVRTGYGGGYMDRQNVEYIEREDNEEFDEFGRKKKRRRVEKNDEELKKIDETREKVEVEVDDAKVGLEEMGNVFVETKSGKNDEEEEDDEEEGNDADLDKYDLSADEFEVEALKAKIAARKAALSSSTVKAGTDSQSRCSSNCSCSCSGGECSCEESETEIERKRPSKDLERDKERGDIRGKDRDSARERERKERDRERNKDEKERSRYGQRKKNSPRRHDTSSLHR